jgi:hypothetical protein
MKAPLLALLVPVVMLAACSKKETETVVPVAVPVPESPPVTVPANPPAPSTVTPSPDMPPPAASPAATASDALPAP